MMIQNDVAFRMVRFGVFELDLKTGELRKKGAKVRLQEQPFQVLAMLVEHAGDLVTRDDLRARLWPEAVFVDFDHGLNKAVTKIRRALGDIAESPVYVETLERRGYRFLAPVEPANPIPRVPLPDVDPGVLRLVWGDRAISLTAGEHLIGRDVAARLWIDSCEVSRRHARIVVNWSGATLEDLASKNGTYLNERKIERSEPLRSGDVIRIGPARIVLRPVSNPTITAAD